MIPDRRQITSLWDAYALPEYKRKHCEAVEAVALALMRNIQEHNADSVQTPVNEHLLRAACLLHDIDKNVEKLPGERHPDAAVRILREKGMGEVADIVQTHPLHTILDQRLSPKTIEEQLVYLSDKMTKDRCIGVEARFALWRNEDTDPALQEIIEKSFPEVMKLRDTILAQAGISERELMDLVA